MTTIYLVRHGEAEQNVLRILNSLSDGERFGLTAAGKERVALTAASLSSEAIDVLFASPMRRTRETAEIIAEALHQEIIFDERLRETDFGIWNGQSADDFWKKYPDPVLRLDGNKEESLEGFRDMRARLGEFLYEKIEQYQGKTIVIVSHGDPLEQMHGILTKEPITTTLSGWYPQKGSATKVVVEDEFLGDFASREAMLSTAHSTEPTSIHPERR